MKVQFLRHAESVFNATGISEKDCNLSEKGIEQAREVSGYYDIVICSTMRRACSTLDHSNLTYGRLIFTDLCREKKVDICDFYPDEDETQLETEEQLQTRIRAFLYLLKSQASQYQSVLVISHRDFIHAVGKGKQPEPTNCEIQVHEV